MGCWYGLANQNYMMNFPEIEETDEIRYIDLRLLKLHAFKSITAKIQKGKNFLEVFSSDMIRNNSKQLLSSYLDADEQLTV